MTCVKIDVDRVLDLHRKGLSDSDISKKCGCTVSSVRNIRVRNGLPANKQYQFRGPAIDEDLALELYNQGFLDQEIANKVHCVRMTIVLFRKRHGLPPNPRNRNQRGLSSESCERMDKEFDEELAFRLWENGLNDAEAAKEIGCRQTAMYYFRHKNDLPPNVFPKLDNDRALELYHSGLNDRQMADRFHVKPSSIWGWRQKNGLPSNYKRPEPRRFRPQEMLSILRRRMSDVKVSGESEYSIGYIAGLKYAISALQNLRKQEGENAQ